MTTCSECGFSPGFEARICPRCGHDGQRAAGIAASTVFDESATNALTQPGACFLVVEGLDAGSKFMLKQGVLVGRDSGCGVALKDPRVSQRHAHVAENAGRWTMTDLEATNGSFLVVGGARRRMREPHVLRDGDEVVVGNTVLRFLELAKGGLR